MTFSDACTFQATTTKRTLELALCLFAVPFLVLLMLGLRRNLEDGLMLGFVPMLPIEDRYDAADLEYTANATLQQERSSSVLAHLETQKMLAHALGLLQTNIVLLLKSVYNHVQNPETAMILQLKVKRTDVREDDYLQTLTAEEKREVRQRRKDKAVQEAKSRGGSARDSAVDGIHQSSNAHAFLPV